MNKIAKSFALLLASAAITSAGCGTMNSTERADPEGTPHVISDKRIVSDAKLYAYLKVIRVNDAVTPDGLTKVQVDLLDDWVGGTSFYYKFEWYDDQGMMVESPMSIWQEKSIQSGERLSIQGIGPTPLAKDFRLKFQLSPD